MPSNWFALAYVVTVCSVVPVARGTGACGLNDVVPPPPPRRAFVSTTTTQRIPRGGSSSIGDDEAMAESAFRISLEDMSKALRWTSEVNRRLQTAELRVASKMAQQLFAGEPEAAPQQQQRSALGTLRGGDSDATQQYQMENSSQFRIPRSNALSIAQPLSIFHIEAPLANKNGDDSPKRGAERWGPRLDSYLEFLTEELKLGDDPSLELSLALIYMDRACSVETARVGLDVAPVPYCTPRSVHRLALTSLLLSLQAIHGRSLEEMHDKLEDSLGIPLEQLEYMTGWMRAALGDDGIFVSAQEMTEWKQNWQVQFPARSSCQRPTEQQEVEVQDLATVAEAVACASPQEAATTQGGDCPHQEEQRRKQSKHHDKADARYSNQESEYEYYVSEPSQLRQPIGVRVP